MKLVFRKEVRRSEVKSMSVLVDDSDNFLLRVVVFLIVSLLIKDFNENFNI